MSDQGEKVESYIINPTEFCKKKLSRLFLSSLQFSRQNIEMVSNVSPNEIENFNEGARYI